MPRTDTQRYALTPLGTFHASTVKHVNALRHRADTDWSKDPDAAMELTAEADRLEQMVNPQRALCPDCGCIEGGCCCQTLNEPTYAGQVL